MILQRSPPGAILVRGWSQRETAGCARLDSGGQAAKKSRRAFVLVFGKGNEGDAVRRFLRFLLSSLDSDRSAIQRIDAMRSEFAGVSDDELRAVSAETNDLLPFMAAAAAAAARILGQEMYDVQLRGALALARGSIAEMQTGEGKTLAAVPAIAWLARERKGVHVMTVNDYLARRDACWMGDIYRFLGLSVGYAQQGMTPAERRAAYACDITYATANEIGFDVRRDRLPPSPGRPGAPSLFPAR